MESPSQPTPLSDTGDSDPSSGGAARSDGTVNVPAEKPRQPPNGQSMPPSPYSSPGSASTSGDSSRPAHWSSSGSWSGGLMFNVVVPLLLILAGIGAIRLFGSVQPATREQLSNSVAARMQRLTPVAVQKVRSLESIDANLELAVDGEVVPYREVSIATEVAGRIIYKSDRCEAGSLVSEGTVLMRIDPTDYKLEVERLSRSKEQAYQALRELEQEQQNTQRLIDVAEEDLKLQERELKRQRSLPKGFASQGEVDAAQRAVLQSRQQLVANQNQLDLLNRRRASLVAAEQLAETQLKTAEVNLQRTEIKAPISGVIVREDAELNTFVSRGNPIVTMEDTSKVEVAASLRMDQLYWLSAQDNRTVDSADAVYTLPETPATIEFELSGRENEIYHWEGRLIGFDGIGLDSATRTVPVRLLVDNPKEYLDENGEPHAVSGPTALVRGMFVEVILKLDPTTKLFAVPEKAIKPGNRIWHFTPDDSVLNDVLAESSGEPEEASGGGLSQAEQDRQLDFDADDWVPGRVSIVQPITPVDALAGRYLSRVRATGKADHAGATDSSANWWVCEVPEGALSDGSMVVLSPLGAISEQGVPARVNREQILAPDRDDAGDTAADTSVVNETAIVTRPEGGRS